MISRFDPCYYYRPAIFSITSVLHNENHVSQYNVSLRVLQFTTDYYVQMSIMTKKYVLTACHYDQCSIVTYYDHEVYDNQKSIMTKKSVMTTCLLCLETYYDHMSIMIAYLRLLQQQSYCELMFIIVYYDRMPITVRKLL